jgi:hypothetical protein
VPSGETLGNGATGAPRGANATPSGGGSVNRTTDGGGVARKYGIASATTPASAIARRLHAIHTRGCLFVTTEIGAPVSEPPAAIHLNSSRRSLASCQRSSGSLARHFPMTRSSAGGVTAATVDTAGGWSLRIAPIKLACVLPLNALRPVIISNSVAPNAKMSDRASTSRPSICSGAMYSNVPTIVP